MIENDLEWLFHVKIHFQQALLDSREFEFEK